MNPAHAREAPLAILNLECYNGHGCFVMPEISHQRDFCTVLAIVCLPERKAFLTLVDDERSAQKHLADLRGGYHPVKALQADHDPHGQGSVAVVPISRCPKTERHAVLRDLVKRATILEGLALYNATAPKRKRVSAPEALDEALEAVVEDSNRGQTARKSRPVANASRSVRNLVS